MALQSCNLFTRVYAVQSSRIFHKQIRARYLNSVSITAKPSIQLTIPLIGITPQSFYNKNIPIRNMSSDSRTFTTAQPGKTSIGWIGTGVMGLHMAGHLLKGGYKLNVYSRTLSKCKPLENKGATVFSNPREVVEASDIVFTIVGYPSDVRSVILDPETGILAGLNPHGIVVDMTTSQPSLAEEISESATRIGCASIDAPVSGGDVGAREARLSIMIGGEKEAVNAVNPLFELMGQNIRHMGGPGAGQHTKMVNQTLIASGMIGVVEGLLYAHKAGLDMDQAIQAVAAGAAGSWSISNLGPRIVQRNFDPGFFVEHFIKDMGIALDEAKRLNLSLPGLSLAHQLYVALQAQGHGRKGTHALMLAFEKLNGIDIDAKNTN